MIRAIDCQRQSGRGPDVPYDDGVHAAKCYAGDKIAVTIIDWEKSGWYPSYWKYRGAFYAIRRRGEDWGLFLCDMLTP